MPIINNKEDYWNTVDSNWGKILAIFQNVGARLDLPFGPYEEILSVSLLEHLNNLKKNRCPEITRYFNAAWGAAPDRPYIHDWLGWDIFCDLCSETWVFSEEE